MSTLTVQIADHAAEIHEISRVLMANAPVLTKDDLEASVASLRLQVARLDGLAKSLPVAVCVRKTTL